MVDNLESYTVCSVCGSREYRLLRSRDLLEYEKEYRDQLFRRKLPQVPESMLDDLTIFTNSYPARLLVCAHCGLVSRDPRFTSEGSIRAYAVDDYSDEWLESTYNEYYYSYSRKMLELKRIVGHKATVLELGSYVGGFLSAARDAGWEAQGVDVGRKVSEFCRDKGLRVFTGTLCDAKLADSSYDAAFIWVCFDQLPTPRQELQEIHRLLRSGGWLFIHVPNGDFVKALDRFGNLGLWETVCKALAYTGMAGFPYQVGYTSKTLARLLFESGYSSLTIQNRMDVCDDPTPSGKRIPEQTLYQKAIRSVTETIFSASRGKLAPGPWLLAVCQRV